MKKWFIALLFVFAYLPVVAIKAAPPQTYIHLDYEIIDGVYYDMGDGAYDDMGDGAYDALKQGETWVIDENPDIINDGNYLNFTITFTSNNTVFYKLYSADYGGGYYYLFYYEVYNEGPLVYNKYYQAWINEAYRTVTFNTAPTGDLLTWLQANAVKQVDGARSYWACSNKIQIPKDVDKLYFSGWHTHFVLFFSDKTYIGFYYEDEFVFDITFISDVEEKMLGSYNYSNDLIHVLEVPTNATHIVLQTCWGVEALDLEDYMEVMPIEFSDYVKPLIYYPAPTDAATNMTFGLMPALMIMVVIAGITGGLIMITKKSKR